jgi:hypothetical protein
LAINTDLVNSRGLASMRVFAVYFSMTYMGPGAAISSASFTETFLRLDKSSCISDSVIVRECRVEFPSTSIFSYKSVRSRNGSLVSSLRSLNVYFVLKMITPTPIVPGKMVAPEKLKDAAKANDGSRLGWLLVRIAYGVA